MGESVPLPPEVREAMERARARALERPPTLHLDVRADGAVEVELFGDGMAVARAQVSPELARCWGDALVQAAGAGVEAQRALRWEQLWICWPDGSSPGRYHVRHGGKTMQFTSVWGRRRAWTCRSCRRVVPPAYDGELYQPEEPLGWWRDVRLCRRCVEQPAGG